MRLGAKDIRVQIDRQGHVGLKGLGERYRHRIDERSVGQPPAIQADGLNKPRNGRRGANRRRDGPLPQPDFPARADVRRQGREGQRQILDPGLAQQILIEPREILTGDKTATAQIDVEIAQDFQRIELESEGLQGIKATGGIGRTDKSADGTADNDIGLEAQIPQRLDDADMGPATGRAAAQNKSEAARGRRYLGVGANHGEDRLLATPRQRGVSHGKEEGVWIRVTG